MRATSRLAVLPPRPPTPPRELFPSMTFYSEQEQPELPTLPRKLSRSTITTPTESPASAANFLHDPSEKRLKRVDFLIGPGGATPVTTSSPEALAHCSANAPSRRIKALKSILKQPNQLSSDPPADPLSLLNDPIDFPRMLEDITRQLASSDMSCRLDAYASLNGCLKTYKTESTLESLLGKSPLLSDFFQRDLSLARNEQTVRNTQVALEVLRLITTLIWSPMTNELVPVGLQIFVLDQAISTIGGGTASKLLTNQYLHLLGIQNFRHNVMTNERATKLIGHLASIHERTSGKQVLAHRLTIYRRLVGQARNVMLSKLDDWLGNVLHGMMADTREIRVRAISLGLDSAQAFGTDPRLFRAVKDCFRAQSSRDHDDTRYGDMFLDRLTKWLESKEDARLVPQIWGTITLLLRYSPREVERWRFIVPWLKLLQKCFNSSDAELKIQANHAWVRFIYVISPDHRTGANMISLLRDPITSQLHRNKVNDKESKKIRACTYSAYYTLLYYALKPGTRSETVSTHWNAYVQHVLSNQSVSSVVDISTISGVLLSLLGGNAQKTWTPDRAVHLNQMKHDEVPPLEPRWVRSNAGSVLKLLEKFLMIDSWWESDDEQPPILRVWQAFTKSISQAGSKEIKVSMEAMKAMAEIVGSINRVYMKCCKGMQLSSEVEQHAVACNRSLLLVEVLASNLGYLILNEKRLIKSSPDSYQAAETPSSRYVKPVGDLASPVGHLLQFFTANAPVEGVGNDCRDLLTRILDLSLLVATSRRTKIRMLRDVTQHALLQSNSDSAAKVDLWDLVARQAAKQLITEPTDESSSEDSQVGHDFREAVKILEAGIRFNNLRAMNFWKQMLDHISSQLHKEAGPAGCALILAEPLARALLDKARSAWHENVVVMTSAILDVLSWPTTQKDVEHSHRALWGTAVINFNKSTLALPYADLYALLNEELNKVFVEAESASAQSLNQLLSSLMTFIRSAPLSIYPSLLASTFMKSGITSCVSDRKAILTTNTPESVATFKTAFQLWASILDKVTELGKCDQELLSSLQELLQAGLASRHRAFANKTITFWNLTFGLVEALTCPEPLMKILLQLSKSAEILMSGMPLNTPESQLSSIDYYDTPANVYEFEEPIQKSGEPNERVSPPGPMSSGTSKAHEFSAQKTPPKQQPGVYRSTPRLHHNDSQIQFAIVDSSPSKLESQLLTEHQREVKERQERDAGTMFADLRSSPKHKTTNKDMPQPRLCLKADRLDSSDTDDVQSPTLPAQESISFLGSSPTPRSRRSSSRDNSNAARPSAAQKGLAMADLLPPDLPSSPPMMPKQASDEQNVKDQASTLGNEAQGKENIIAEEVVDVALAGQGAAEVACDIAVNEARASELPDADAEEIFLDAVASPLNGGTSEKHGSRTVLAGGEDDQIALPFDRPVTMTSSFTSNSTQYDPDPVEAQIQNDMEMAMSQSQEKECQPQISDQKVQLGSARGRGKRKASSPSPNQVLPKRGKGRPRKSSVRAMKAEGDRAQESEEEILDTIVLSSDSHERGRSLKRQRDASHEVQVSSNSQDRPASKKSRTGSNVTANDDGAEARAEADLAEDLTGGEGATLSQIDMQEFNGCTNTGDVVVSEAVLSAPIGDQVGVIDHAKPACEMIANSTENQPSQGSGSEVLAQVKALLAQVKVTKLGEASDEIMTTLMEVGREVMEAKRREVMEH
ncbi:MAG: hypothetical protein MMC23_008255 [Stictis urceolatum]|nr:hypothetical protein [Stictis urceolata]